MQRIILITCEVCNLEWEIDLDEIEAGKLTPAEPIRMIEKHLEEEHGVDPVMAMKRKPSVIN